MPDKLDLNSWIQYALYSEDEISRQIALEELITNGVPPYLQAKISEISSRDVSSVCRQLASWVDSLERARIELKPLFKGAELSTSFVRELMNASESARAAVLPQFLRKAPAEDILDQWRELLVAEKNPRMLEIALTILGKFGRASDADAVPMLLLDGDSDVICAGLSLLQQRDVNAFKVNVRQGLSSRSFKVKLHAVHLLRMVDCEEATKYIESLLFHKNALIRQKALREMVLVGFDKVENLCMQYLSRETQPLLLVKAGFLLAFNPSKDTPLKLFDILNLANDSKRHILQLILRQIVEAIQAAGILNQTLESYMSELKQKIRFRKSEQVIRCALRDLASKDEIFRISAIERLTQYAGYPSIGEALIKHLESEKSANVRQMIEEITGSDKKISVCFTDSFPEADELLKLKPGEQKKTISSISSSEAFSKVRNKLASLTKHVGKNILLEILKVYNRFGSRLDSPVIIGFLDDQDASIVAQAIRTLGAIDIDAILPHLNRFLAHDDPRIKAAAFEAFLQTDKEAAVQYLASMLKSAAVATRRIGLSLLPQLDYPSAEPLLWNRLRHEANAELKLQAGYMVAANPTREGIQKLYGFSHDKNGEVKPGYDEIWNLALMSAENAFQLPPAQIESDCWEYYKVELEQAATEKSSYAFSSVVGDNENDHSGTDQNEFSEKLFDHLFDFKWHYIIGFFLTMPFIYNIFNTSHPVSVHHSRTPSGNAQTSFLKTESVSSGPDTQVDTPDWQGTLKTGARQVLSGKAYSQTLTAARAETARFFIDYDRNFRQRMLELANDSSEPEEVRMLAAANLNESYSQANNAWIQGNFSEAELYFEEAVNDNRLNSYGKCMALMRLSELAEQKKDRVNWIKWQDRLLKELKNIPGYEDVEGFDNFANTFGKMIEVSRSLSGGVGEDTVLDGLKSQGESSRAAEDGLKSLKEMSSQFQQMFGNN